MECILMPEQYWLLWHTSWFALVSAIFAALVGKYDLVIVPLGVFLTSINYWWLPDYSWRRYLDMGVVIMTFVYQAWRAYGMTNAVVYYGLAGIAVGCFPIAVVFYQQNMWWASTVAHAGIHVFGNMANMILYAD